MSSRSPLNHDPYEHFATREALAEVATRLDATLPHLATKADVERMGNRLLFWLTGTLVTCLLTFYGLHVSLMGEIQAENRATQQQTAAELQRIAAQLDRLDSQREEQGPRRP